jgi:FAD/FMN-containing dehydrogenase
MTISHPSPALLDRLAGRLGPHGFTADRDAMVPWLTDWRGRVTGRAAAMLSPADAAEIVDIIRWAAEEGVAIVPQDGRRCYAIGRRQCPAAVAAADARDPVGLAGG